MRQRGDFQTTRLNKRLKERSKRERKRLLESLLSTSGAMLMIEMRNNINMKQYGTLPYPVIPNEYGGDEFAVKKYCKYEYEQ